MKIACISFSKKGSELGDEVENLSNEKYNILHYRNRDLRVKVPVFLKKYWDCYDGFIFIGATGIAVRYISPFIKDKTIDPAILVIDDLGRFVISLLSGHLGGANELTNYIGNRLGSISVVTTATDGRGIESVDMFAKRNNFYIESMKDVKCVTSVMVNGGKLGFYSEESKVINYNNLIQIDDLSKLDKDIEGVLIVSNKKNIEFLEEINIPTSILRPRNINVGIGCRKGMEGGKIIKSIKNSLDKVNKSEKSLKSIGTIEIKKDEKGIIEAAKHFQIPMYTFEVDEIIKVENKFSKSKFVKDTVGVYSVSEPAAYLLGNNMLLEKSVHDGITISISEGGNDE